MPRKGLLALDVQAIRKEEHNMAKSLVSALKEYFEIPGSDMIREWKSLSEKDKDDFVDMFAAIGIEVTRDSK